MNHLAGLTPDELREAVRAVLREVLPDGVVADTGAGRHEVTLATDADLTAFVRRVAAMCEDAEVRAALQDGQHGFRLGSAVEVRAERALRGSSQAPRTSGTTSKPPSMRVERGAVTERTVVKAAAEGARLVLGRRAVLTPLGRDKARALGVTIEKEH